MASNEPTYEVGYGKPPQSTQFQKGRSGNPNGRPKRTAGFGPLFEKVIRQLVVVNEQGRSKRISLMEVIVMQIVKKAATGNLPFIRLVLAQIANSDLMRGGSAGPQILEDLTKLSDEELSARYAERINYAVRINSQR